MPSSVYFLFITWWWPVGVETCCECNNKNICFGDGTLPPHFYVYTQVFLWPENCLRIVYGMQVLFGRAWNMRIILCCKVGRPVGTVAYTMYYVLWCIYLRHSAAKGQIFLHMFLAKRNSNKVQGQCRIIGLVMNLYCNLSVNLRFIFGPRFFFLS